MSTLENRPTVTITKVTDKAKFVRVTPEQATPDCLLYDTVSGEVRPAFHETYRGRNTEWVINERRPNEILVKRVEANAGFSFDDVVQLMLSRVCWD